MNIEEMRSRGMSIKPTIMVGRSGLTEGIVEELKDQLERRELVKIRFQRSMGPSAAWKDELKEIIDSMKATLVEIKGSTALVYKRSSRKNNK